jgi:serine/threonine-protein kinase
MGIEAGQRIGDYQVIRALGVGGLGAVYEVKHVISGRSEALKVVLPGLVDTPEMAERFHREIRLLASLNHFNIAGLHTAFYHENQLVMVMEFVEGQTFAAITRGAPVSIKNAVDWISQVLLALGVAHAAGIVHRDIKPGNIMLTKDGVVKLLDFGIAFRETAPHLTRAGHIFGSLNYMAPEQFTGGPVTPLSDIYSTGITLYELVTRQLPFIGSTTYEIMNAHLEKPPIPPNQLNPGLPPFLCQAIERALAKSPAQRFQSADEFRLALHGGAEELNGLAVSPAGLADTWIMPLSPTPAHGYPAGSSSKPPSTQRPAPTHSRDESPLPVEEVTKLLAVHIGPVAKFVVKKLSATCTSADQLYAAAAKEIPSTEARNQFLRSRRH